MRVLILIAGAALATSACNKDQAAGNAAQSNDNPSAVTIAANDVTAIDAATSDDANMAEDVNYTVNVDENADANADGNAPANSAANNSSSDDD